MKAAFYRIVIRGVLPTLFYVTSYAADVPDWFSRPIAEDDKSYFGYGLGEGASDGIALKEASAEVLDSLVKSNLGFEFSSETEVKSDVESVQIQRASHQATALLKLSEVMVTKVEKITKPDGSILYFVQRAAPKAMVRKIRIELDKVPSGGERLVVVNIDTKPSGAEVLVDGRSMGASPLRAFISKGTHQITAMLVGYRDAERKLVLDKNTDYSFDIPMEGIDGKLKVKVMPKSAELKVLKNGEEYHGGRENMPPGEYILLASKEGYVTKRQTVVINSNRTTVAEINLSVMEQNEHEPDQAEGDSLDRQMEQLIASRDHKKAKAFLGGVYLKHFGKSAKYFYYQGVLLIENGQNEAALRPLKTSYSMQMNPAVQIKICVVQYELQNYEEAIRNCNAALNYISNWEIHLYKARSNLKLALENFVFWERYTQEAVNSYKILVRTNPEYLDEWREECAILPYSSTTACKSSSGIYGFKHKNRSRRSVYSRR